MKKKKRLLNIGAFLIFLVIYTIPFINWERKNKIHDNFREIERDAYNLDFYENPSLFDSLLVLEKRVNDFTLTYPVPENLTLGDFVSNSDTTSKKNQELRSNFIDKVNLIDNFYRKAERKSHIFMFLNFIIAFGILALMRHYINKLVK